MIDIKIGTVLTAYSVTSGTSDYYGDWEQIVVRDEATKTKKKGQGLMLPILIQNRPCGVQTGGTFKVTSIEGIQLMLKQRSSKQGATLYDQQNKAIKERVVKIYATVEPVDAPVTKAEPNDIFDAPDDDIFGEAEEKEEIPFWLR